MPTDIIIPAITLTVAIRSFTLFANGDFSMSVDLLDPTGAVRASKQYTVKADGSGVTDNYGTQVADSVPSGWLSCFAMCVSGANDALGAMAADGKITL